MEQESHQEPPRLTPRQLGSLKLEAASRRRRRLRRNVLAGAATVFISAWSVLFGQAYLKSRSAATTSQAAAPTTTTSAPTDSESYVYEDDYSYGPPAVVPSTPAPAPAPAPVTTSQS